MGGVCRNHGLSPASFYKLKAKFGGMEVSDSRRLKSIEEENAKLKLLVADTAVVRLVHHSTILELSVESYR